ncbi:MAG: serine--tRNA ligase [Pelagibacteraceae bacterium TMED216]|nr:MAG: serine--tRNA ligase [Pelagibacteraceae bacterium TMED216]|tara:strand:+ start:19 stop:1272 length:1254 start_codon:yes stop_codon:yes gene_type:complete
MHNLKEIRNNLEYFSKKISERNVTLDSSKLLDLDKQNRELIQNKEKLEQEKKNISKLKDKKTFERSKELTIKINQISDKQSSKKKELNNLLSSLPNLSLADVPVGKDEKSNKIIKNEGKIKTFDFKIKSHVELGKKSGGIDFETATKLSGSRFVVLKNNFALLERALINFMLDIHTNKFGYEEISPPVIVNEDVMYGTGQLPKFEEDQFEIKTQSTNSSDKKFLIPTAEVVLTNLVRNSVINKTELPKRFVASTPCFRKEAGSYGKDTKGMIRQHQFFKVELVSIVEPSECKKELDRKLNCAQEILKLLDLPYQVVLLSTGDMGFSAEKTYDIEVWMPYEKKYREISSCSSCGTFQARRMSAKYKSEKGSDFLGTLNGSGLAVGRLMIALMENNQNPDGTINIPPVLKKYMNNLNKI